MYPAHPERVCWGCDRYCPAHDMVCGNGSERTQHPIELFGDDWAEWAAELRGDASTPDPSASLPEDGAAVPRAVGGSSLGSDQAPHPIEQRER